MTSSTSSVRTRKRPEDRREDILSEAATIAIEEGLERITLRAVAARLGVRPGLITHYFPAAEDLVVQAFARAAVIEREEFFRGEGPPLERLAHFLGYIESGTSRPFARLWLNARHLSRFSPAIEALLEEQDLLDRARLSALIDEGVTTGDFQPVDASAASIRIFIAIDGGGSYVNSTNYFSNPEYERFATSVAEWSLGLTAGTIRNLIDAAPEWKVSQTEPIEDSPTG